MTRMIEKQLEFGKLDYTLHNEFTEKLEKYYKMPFIVFSGCQLSQSNPRGRPFTSICVREEEGGRRRKKWSVLIKAAAD